MSRTVNLSVGCYCPSEDWCHRSVLRELLEKKGADVEERDEDEEYEDV